MSIIPGVSGAQHAARFRQIGMAKMAVRFEIGAFRPFVPGVDENQPLVAREFAHGGGASGPQPSPIHGRGRTTEASAPCGLRASLSHDGTTPGKTCLIAAISGDR